MASIGLKMPVFAPHKNPVEFGVRPEYNPGFVIGHGIKADVTINFADATLYGDDILIEEDSSFQNATVTLGVDEISADVDTKMFGSQTVEVEGTTELHVGAKNVAPRGGFGYYKTKTIKSVPGFLGKFFLDCKFKRGNDTSETKGDSTNFSTPEITGNIFAVPGLEEDTYVEEAFFTSESECQAWLRKKANISSTRVAVQNVSTTSTTSVTPKSTTSLSTDK